MAFMFQTFSNEGSSDPFFARLMMGIFELRDQAFQSQADRTSFDASYRPALEGASACREATKKIVSMLDDHRAKLRRIHARQQHAIELPESIDAVLAENIRTLLVNGVIAIKHLQKVVRPFDIEIGSLFAKKVNFEKGMTSLRTVGHAPLADFLCETRVRWSASFVKRRDELEHAGWTLPKCGYKRIGIDTIELIEPDVNGLPITVYSQRILHRVLSFIENVVVYAFQSFLPEMVAVVEIPVSQRDPDKPARFRATLKGAGETEWKIVYSETDFP